MQQQCVYFHTEKEPKETEKILKKEKMQIMFKSEQVILRLQDLTDEEKDSWEKYQLEQINSFIERIDILEHTSQENLKKVKSANKELFKFIHSCKNDVGKINVNKAIEERLNQILKNISYEDMYMAERNLMVEIPYLFENKISCSCIIAKQGENFVRYLQFIAYQDPVLTITGPNADSIKSTLEEKF